MKVEIWSDVTCTHCYTSKRKFEEALSQFKHRDKIEISRRSFELAPGYKTDPGILLPQFLQQMHGTSMEQVLGMIGHVTGLAQQVGLEYDLNKAIPANSFNAHRLSHFAKAQGKQEGMEERLYKAYFTEGKNIDDIATLTALAAEIGLNAEDVKKMLESTDYAAEVNHDLAAARQSGITSVPNYTFNTNRRVSGGQESETYLEILEKEFAIWQSGQAENTPEIAGGQSCVIGESC